MSKKSPVWILSPDEQSALTNFVMILMKIDKEVGKNAPSKTKSTVDISLKKKSRIPSGRSNKGSHCCEPLVFDFTLSDIVLPCTSFLLKLSDELHVFVGIA